MTRGEKNRNGSLQTDCDSRTGSEVESKGKLKSLVGKLFEKRHAGSGLGRLPLTKKENWCRYADWRPNLYHQIKWVSSLVAVPNDLPLYPLQYV